MREWLYQMIPLKFKYVESIKNKNLIGLLPLEGKYVRTPFYDDSI